MLFSLVLKFRLLINLCLPLFFKFQGLHIFFKLRQKCLFKIGNSAMPLIPFRFEDLLVIIWCLFFILLNWNLFVIALNRIPDLRNPKWFLSGTQFWRVNYLYRQSNTLPFSMLHPVIILHKHAQSILNRKNLPKPWTTQIHHCLVLIVRIRMDQPRGSSFAEFEVNLFDIRISVDEYLAVFALVFKC